MIDFKDFTSYNFLLKSNKKFYKFIVIKNKIQISNY